MNPLKWKFYLTSNRNIIATGETEDGKMDYLVVLRRWQNDPKEFRFFFNEEISSLGELKALTKRLEVSKTCECSLEEAKMEATKILMKKTQNEQKSI